MVVSLVWAGRGGRGGIQAFSLADLQSQAGSSEEAKAQDDGGDENQPSSKFAGFESPFFLCVFVDRFHVGVSVAGKRHTGPSGFDSGRPVRWHKRPVRRNIPRRGVTPGL